MYDFFAFLNTFYTPASFVSNIFIFILGALVGSFINVCVYRLPIGRSIVLPGSACTVCGEPVKWYFNIPIFSYFFLRGRCSACSAPFSIRYAFIEFLSGIGFLFIFHRCGSLSPLFLSCVIFFFVLLVVFLIDYDHWLILDSVSIPFIIISFFLHVFTKDYYAFDSMLNFFFPFISRFEDIWILNAFNSLSGILIGFLTFSLIAFWGMIFFRQEAMGGGDIKFAMLIGAYLGFDRGFAAFFLSFFIGFLYVIPLLFKKRNIGGTPLPFGTFMAIAAFLIMMFDFEIFSLFIL